MRGKSLNLLVYEHVTGGGFSGGKIPPSILSEGYAMLKALISDFKAAGHNVTTFLDSRLRSFNPPLGADNIIPSTSYEGLDEALEEASRSVDGVYIIAPESGRVLQKLVESVEASGGISLNCRVNAIEKASNKMAVHGMLKEAGLNVPETLIVDLCEDVKQIERRVGELGFPLIFKPVDGVGCCGLSVVRDKSQIAAAVNRVMRESSSGYFIAQRLVKGVAASVSLISTEDEALPVTLNKQAVTLAPPNLDSSYNGGFVPLHHSLEKEALRAARTAVEFFKGVRGYVGVDVILTRKEPVVVEVNPRLTTSYVGLREVVNFNPAQAIADAVLKRKLPESVRTSGYAFFSKVKVPAPTYNGLLKTYRLSEVLSPPFPVAGGGVAYALLVSHSAGLEDAEAGFHKAEGSLLDALSKDD
jgi:predicted ATP-grasp superfamily ATP-dependent carboligase